SNPPHTLRENIVPFPPNGPEATAPTLTPGEHMAFRELSRKLTQGLAEVGIQSGSTSAAPAIREQTVRDATHIPGPPSHLRPMLDRIPAGILVYRLNQLLYANPRFLQWSGYPTLDALVEAGGLDELFIEPTSASAAQSDRSVTLKMDRGDKLTLDG